MYAFENTSFDTTTKNQSELFPAAVHCYVGDKQIRIPVTKPICPKQLNRHSA